MDKATALAELEKARNNMLLYINTKFDALVARVEGGEAVEGNPSDIDMLYPLCINPATFKGTKPTAVYFGGEMIGVKTWRAVYTLILQRCATIPEKHNRLMSLRNRISGRNRTFLSDKPIGMNAPVKIAEELFAEAYLDTEWLIKVLTTEILYHAHYDYSHISISVTTAKTKSNVKERRAEYSRAYREANREKINAYQREWHAKRRKK